MRYFGYGSNLCALDLSRWCRERDLPALHLARIGPAFLPDRRLAFTHRSRTRGGGVLDIPQARGNAVAGVLFQPPSNEAIATLDRKEAEGHTYRRIETVALTENGSDEQAFSYEVDPSYREAFVAPALTYLEVVRRGYTENGVLGDSLETAARGSSHPGPIAGLFVYGTLRRGEERHPVLIRHRASRGEAASTAGSLLDLGPYPGLVLGGPAAAVIGEFYSTPDPDPLYGELDEIESFRGFGVPGSVYRRTIVRVECAERGSTLAWTYVYEGPRSGTHVISSGDWRDRRTS